MRNGSSGQAVLFTLGGVLCVTALVLGSLKKSTEETSAIAPLMASPEMSRSRPTVRDPVDKPEIYRVGVSEVDITPDYPIRLGGFGNRRAESEGVTSPISAKAMAISHGSDPESVVLITVDSIGIPASMSDEVARRLHTKTGLNRAGISIAASHSHTTPQLRGLTPTIFGEQIPDAHLTQIDRYTADLTDKLEQVAMEAWNHRQESYLSWGIGSVGFAVNRRTKGGPVDHDLPVLAVKGLDGRLRAVYLNYACHCVTLSDNSISGDWAGYAQDLLQREFPSTVAMISIGCGADQNPSIAVTGGKTDVALKQGHEIADEVKRLLNGFLVPIHGAITTDLQTLTLDFQSPPTMAEWEERSKKPGAAGYHARVQLDRLARGESLPTELPYPILSWAFGKSLAMVFLPGEPVVDYALRLKRELDGQRLWLNGYSNDLPCYIPSERVLSEGGYEGGGSMIYFDQPGPLKTGLEEKIVGAVREKLRPDFDRLYDPDRTRGSRSQSPWQSLAALQTTSNLRVDLVVSEPLISDPVAIDFGLDGSLWVAEMRDYPEGLPVPKAGASRATAETEFVPGGRIRLVRDRDGDGQFDSSTVFLDNISFPTGVTVWRHGVLICAAPDILYAEDTDGDDRADEVRKLYSGFGTSNNQARVNSLCYGLDGWIHGSCGLFGGTITSFNGKTYELGDRDFRIRPETGEIEPTTGRTQQGRVRDDYGNWFGCDNTSLAFHYPLAEHYLSRNPFVTSPPSRVSLTPTEDSRRLFPARNDALRFSLSGPPAAVTAACGIGVYRDQQLGPDYAQNLFVCEPVNLLVHRIIPKPMGTSFVADRASNEQRTEFLRSTDAWFRPVQAVTGPDGGLWVVDMYRFLIEDPRWIPEHELAPLDVRAGSGMGRIYRVRSANSQAPPAVRPAFVPGARQSPVLRELQLQWLGSLPNSESAIGSLTFGKTATRPVAGSLSDPIARIEFLRELSAGHWISQRDIEDAMADPNPRIRAFGILLAEQHLAEFPLPKGLVDACDDADLQVRLQAACSLGEWTSSEIGPLLARMALNNSDDPYIVAAVYSSVSALNLKAFTATLFEELSGREPPAALMTPLLTTAVGFENDAAIRLGLDAIAVQSDDLPKVWQLAAVAKLLDAISKAHKSHPVDAAVQQAIERMEQSSRAIVADDRLDEHLRLTAINLLGRNSRHQDADAQLILQQLTSAQSPAIQLAVIDSLERIGTDNLPATLTQRFRELSPSVQHRIVDALLNRQEWMDDLFAGFQQGTIPLASLTAEQRQELLGHPHAAIRERATALLAGSLNSNRREVVQQYHEALQLSGDLERGRLLFARVCSGCHRLGNTGHTVGPNLGMIANKSPSFLLQEILDPNRNVDARYTSYVALTKEGLTRTGLMSSESSNSVTLVSAEEKRVTLLRQEIDELRSTGKSLMPEGLEKDLPPQAMADLILFLTSAPAPTKQVAGNQPATVKPLSGRLHLMASTASIVGDQITFEPVFSNIGYWHSLQDHLSWAVETPQSSDYDVYLEWACDAASAGNRFVLSAGAASVSCDVESTGGWDHYKLARIGTLTLNSGMNRVVMRPDGALLRGAMMDLRGLHLVAAGEPFELSKVPVGATTLSPKEIAQQILKEGLSEEESKSIVLRYPEIASQLIVAMTDDLPDDLKEEYRRIPKIWQVAVACGKRNQIDEMRQVLSVSLPERDQVLKDWQAVVVGGGLINGIGLVGGWPKSRLQQVLADQPGLTERWQSTLDKAARMSGDERVNTGTRYDAMRIIALDDRSEVRALLNQYLAKGTHDELQMGAVSGLSDIESDDVPRLLIENLGHFNDENRGLAIDALLRFDGRAEKLLDAVEKGRIASAMFTADQRKRLIESRNPELRQRAIDILGQ